MSRRRCGPVKFPICAAKTTTISERSASALGHTADFCLVAIILRTQNEFMRQLYLITKIMLDKSAEIARNSIPGIRSMMKISSEEIERGINIPWAYFNHGLFCYLGGDETAGLDSYLLGVHYCTARWMLATHLNDLTNLRPVDGELPGLKNVRHLLRLALALRFGDEQAIKRLTDNHGTMATDLNLPLTIIVGTTNQTREELGQELHDLLLGAFGSYEGTVISGSTTSGVCQIVGDIQSAFPSSLRTIGYIPKKIPKNVEVDFRFTTIHRTEGSDFSFLEALRYWTDIALNGVDPAEIRLLGIGAYALT